MPKHPSTVTLSKFRGLDNKNPDNRTDPTFLTTADNIDIDSVGSIRKRLGYSEAVAGTNMHSLWGDDEVMYFFNDGDLTRLNLDGTTTVLGSNYPENRTDFYKTGDRTYFTSSGFNGIIEGDNVRPWGIDTPNVGVTVTSSNAGNVQAAITFITADGRESGATIATPSPFVNGIDIDVTRQNLGSPGTVTVSGIPTSTDSDVTSVNVYITQLNGEVLQHSVTVSNGTSSAVCDPERLGRALSTQFVIPAPYGDIVEHYNGRLYVAAGNILLYSNPMSPEWFNRSDFFQFPAPITNVMPVDDGIYVTADRLYFLEGSGPERFKQREREIYKAVKYTAVKIVGSDIILENIPTGLKWLFNSDKGFVMVGTGGMVFNLTEKNVMIGKSNEGAAFFKSQDGMNQYVSVLKDPETNRMHVGDTAQAQVIRNGIVIT